MWTLIQYLYGLAMIGNCVEYCGNHQINKIVHTYMIVIDRNLYYLLLYLAILSLLRKPRNNHYTNADIR